jgi:cbb3-type cytochrome oxidase subunit 3
MKLSDVMGAAELAVFAEGALILFFAAFVTVLVRSVGAEQKARAAELSRLPLADDQATEPSERSAL